MYTATYVHIYTYERVTMMDIYVGQIETYVRTYGNIKKEKVNITTSKKI